MSMHPVQDSSPASARQRIVEEVAVLPALIDDGQIAQRVVAIIGLQRRAERVFHHRFQPAQTVGFAAAASLPAPCASPSTVMHTVSIPKQSSYHTFHHFFFLASRMSLSSSAILFTYSQSLTTSS